MAASDNLGSVFHCPICFEKFNIPKYLPCLHTFCELCVQSFIDSSLSDINNHKRIFMCPVCRIEIEPPFPKITAENWAKTLPLNHQLIAFQDSCFREDNSTPKCDSCMVSDRKNVLAVYRCKQCNDNLCKACFEIIHQKIPKHTAVDLREKETKPDNPDKCSAHPTKSVEVYCFDHKKLGCSFCLTTEHVKCRTVLSLDKISEDDLEKSMKTLIDGTRQMINSTRIGIEATQGNIKKLEIKEDEIIRSVVHKIDDIKQSLDNLILRLKSSINRTNKEKIADLTIGLKELKSFDEALLQKENAASVIMKNGNKKDMLVAIEKTKAEISMLLKSLASQKAQMKRTEINWAYVSGIEKLCNLRKLGGVKYSFQSVDWVTQIESKFHAMEKEVHPNAIAYGCIEMKEVTPRRVLRGHTNDFTNSIADQPVVVALHIGDTSWNYSFSFHCQWSKVFEDNRLRTNDDYSEVSLLLNPDKTLKAFGYEAQEKYIDLCENNDQNRHYFFKNITSIFENNKIINEQTKLTDTSGKEMGAEDVFLLAIQFLVLNMFGCLQERLPMLVSNAKYVMVVASEWNEHAQRFLREIALKAGIESSLIVLKAEAAFVHCQYLAANGKFEGKGISQGKKYLIADLGDRTSKLTVHRKNEDGRSDEILKMGIAPWGLQSMVADFDSFLTEIVGDGTMLKFKTNFPEYYSEMMKQVRFKLRWKGRNKINISNFPASTIEESRMDAPWISFEEAIEMSPYAGKIQFKKSPTVLAFEKEDFEKILERTIFRITTNLKDIMDIEGIDTSIMFGSLAECLFVQNAVREALRPKAVVVLTADEVESGGVYIGHMIE